MASPSLTTIAPAAAATLLAAQLRAHADPARAAAQKAYMKSARRFHGVTVPQLRRTAAAFCRAHALSGTSLRAVVDALFATDYFDLWLLGVLLLQRRRALLAPRDLPWLIKLVRQSSAWALVDTLATKVIGPTVARDPRRQGLLRRWSQDRHLWVRRTALLAQHDELRAGRGDFALFASIAAPLLIEKDFFIRKAIGWVLREVAKNRPQLVFDFLELHRRQVSGLTLREGARALPAAMQARLRVPG